MALARPSVHRLWIVPTAVLMGIALAIFLGLFAIDHYATGGGDQPVFGGPLGRYLGYDPDSIGDITSGLGAMNAAVLGIVITVVSIVVQLSASLYPGVARMFVRDTVNLAVLTYYVVWCVVGVCVALSLHADFVPRVALTVQTLATTLGVVVMLPYFAYVFWFLEPGNIVARIRADALDATARGAGSPREAEVGGTQVAALSAMEELFDVTNNSITGKDKIIASAAVDALKDYAIDYLRAIKPRAAESWFRIGRGLGENPDFVAMDRESLGDLERRRTWFEWKVLRQYLGLYNEGLQLMRDICYLVAIDTRYLGEAAIQAKDRELVALVLRYFNSYLRATLNARDVRTAYNILNQYRLLVEALLRHGEGEAAIEAVKRMKYYGHVSFDLKLTFVTETIAHDVCRICQHALDVGSPVERELLAEFLELDRPLGPRAEEKGLLGVRKAQTMLAAHCIVAGAEDRARLIASDLASEPRERLRAIRDELKRVTTKDFWEITDRGRNFEYMPPAERASLDLFFTWLGVDGAAPANAPTQAAREGKGPTGAT